MNILQFRGNLNRRIYMCRSFCRENRTPTNPKSETAIFSLFVRTKFHHFYQSNTYAPSTHTHTHTKTFHFHLGLQSLNNLNETVWNKLRKSYHHHDDAKCVCKKSLKISRRHILQTDMRKKIDQKETVKVTMKYRETLLKVST